MYSGMMDAMINIPREEGIGGLFKGIQPALIRQVSYTGLALVVFEPVMFYHIFPIDPNHPFYSTRLRTNDIFKGQRWNRIFNQ